MAERAVLLRWFRALCTVAYSELPIISTPPSNGAALQKIAHGCFIRTLWYIHVAIVLQANHLVGLKGKYLKLRFHSVEDLIKAKR